MELLGNSILLGDIFDKRAIKVNLVSTTKVEAFMELIDTLAAVHSELNRDTMLAVIQGREEKMNTAIVEGIAVPHGYYPGTNGIFGAFGISAQGIEYDTPDHKPVHCIFLLILGEAGREKHLHVLNRVMSLINSEAVTYMRNAADAEEISGIFSHAD